MKNDYENYQYSCHMSIESCIRSRRCFMTGEYCSKQPNIQYERRKLHEQHKIRAFVIMNFSDMSDVVYKWRMRPFIESLSKYFYFADGKLYCSSSDKDKNRTKENMVKEIEVIRSDSDPASNYVVCNRICQQMQIADLVIVDVSSQNANVFYEFGMAVALGKMILPICYSESFYKMVIPDTSEDKVSEEEWKKIEHHIGLYPWRKALFEYYGIRYRRLPKEKDELMTRYMEFDTVIKSKYNFSDKQYNRFPYHEILPDGKKLSNGEYEKVGQSIYGKLCAGYNENGNESNTLIVYTMDTFLNEEQAGLCIVNFYHHIVSRMKLEQCFCGERVGVLVQANMIPENEKDAKEELDIEYSVGEIIQIGTNQATYLATEEKIKSNDEWEDLLGHKEETDNTAEREQKNEIERFTKNHITNRAMRIYPNHPVFVDRMKNLLHKDLICDINGLFNLYYVMLRTLRYTNEIVVDVSNNCLQSLFWLGAAHGSDVHAITVMHEKTDAEKLRNADAFEKENRNVFDVAGLWMAILRKNDIEGFYLQLAAAQSGIERHSKLMLLNSKNYKKESNELLFSFYKTSKDEKNKLDELYAQKEKDEKRSLESYYRDRFWAPILGYNQLSIYLTHRNDQAKDEEPRLCMSKWDFDAVAVLSKYLSKRKLIGEYSLVSLQEKEKDENADKLNFICIGSESHPLGVSLPCYICNEIKGIGERISFLENKEDINIIHERRAFPGEDEAKIICTKWIDGEKYFKGFFRINIDEVKEFEGQLGIGEISKDGIFTHQPKTYKCAECRSINSFESEKKTNIYFNRDEIEGEICQFAKEGTHSEIAQLILWREKSENEERDSLFRVGIRGSSGPATFALSALFVSEEHIENYFIGREGEDRKKPKKDNLLCELQSNVRKRFMDIFLQVLDKEIGNKIINENDSDELKNEKKKSFKLIKYAVVFYLKTVLYRYFFPFLSQNDIERIYSGMYTFLNSMKVARVSVFSKDKYFQNGFANHMFNIDIIEEIPKILRTTLKDFRGLEAFYEIEVKHFLNDPCIKKDTRQVRGIQPVKRNEMPLINYFYIPE